MGTLFLECTEAGEVNDPYFREKGVKIFLCRTPEPSVQAVYAQKAASEKKKYLR